MTVESLSRAIGETCIGIALGIWLALFILWLLMF